MFLSKRKRIKEITVSHPVKKWVSKSNPLFFQDRLLGETFQMESRGFSFDGDFKAWESLPGCYSTLS